MNLGLWPEAVPYDPDDGAGSEELERQLAEASFPSAALVVVGRSLQGLEWAPRAAIGFARALSATGRDVLLADLDFETPFLHELLSESAVEGLADVLLFGASLERVTVMPAGQPFDFVATGGWVPDAEALRGERSWTRLLSELGARDTVFLGFTRSEAPGLERLVERIPAIVLLSAPDDAAQTVARLPDQIRIEAMIRPPETGAPEAEPTVAAASGGVEADAEASAATAEPPGELAGIEEGADAIPVETDSEAQDEAAASAAKAGPAVAEEAAGSYGSTEEPIRLPQDEAREALIADLEARERVARAQAESGTDEKAAERGAAVPASGGADIDEIAESIAARPRPKRMAWRWLAAAAVIIAGGGSAWYFGFGQNADLEEPAQAPPQAALRQAPPEPVGEPLGWSVAIAAHDRIDLANRSAADLGAADSSHVFYVAPAVVNGDLWYRVLAGPLRDSIGAVQAMQRLVDSGLKRGANIWDVRKTDLTFLLGRFPRESDAAARVQEVADLGVPAYILEVPYSHGEPWYHVYGGAYSSDTPTEAGAMRQMLLDAGLPDSLIVRTGRSAT